MLNDFIHICKKKFKIYSETNLRQNFFMGGSYI
jgi:hypothetical protein